MAKPNTEIYVTLTPGREDRVLVGGNLLAVASDRYHGDFEGTALELRENMELFLCRELPGGFAQESVRVVSVERADDRVLVELEIKSASTPAEHRRSQRVWARDRNLISQLDSEACCPVIDVSETGFSIASTAKHEIGKRLDAVLHYDGQELRGAVVVRNATQLEDERIRYGLHCVDDPSAPEPAGMTLREGLSLIQRELTSKAEQSD